MNNWMEKFERRKDKQRELQLKGRLEKCLDYLENKTNLSSVQKVKVLEEIVEIYHDLELEICEFDRYDYENKRRELEELRTKIAYKGHSQDKEAVSWNEYKEEEFKCEVDYGEDIEEDIEEER